MKRTHKGFTLVELLISDKDDIVKSLAIIKGFSAITDSSKAID